MAIYTGRARQRIRNSIPGAKGAAYKRNRMMGGNGKGIGKSTSAAKAVNRRVCFCLGNMSFKAASATAHTAGGVGGMFNTRR
jgi:hypothetical protein